MTPQQFRDALAELGLSGNQAAIALHLSRRQITKLLNGQSAIEEQIALRIDGLRFRSGKAPRRAVSP